MTWVLVFFSFSMPSSDILVMETVKLPYEFHDERSCRETEAYFHAQTDGLITDCIGFKKPDFFL